LHRESQHPNQATQFACTAGTGSNKCPTGGNSLPSGSLLVAPPTVGCDASWSCRGLAAAPTISSQGGVGCLAHRLGDVRLHAGLGGQRERSQPASLRAKLGLRHNLHLNRDCLDWGRAIGTGHAEGRPYYTRHSRDRGRSGDRPRGARRLDLDGADRDCPLRGSINERLGERRRCDRIATSGFAGGALAPAQCGWQAAGARKL
jgi:hypothetical protein